jgi:hypothetical protein
MPILAFWVNRFIKGHTKKVKDGAIREAVQ